MRGGSTLSVMLACALVAGCGNADAGEAVTVSAARIGEPTGPNAALYFTAAAGDDADRLVAARTEVAAGAQIHETTHGEDGTMGMMPVEGLDLPAGGTLVLEPGGYHLMLIDVERLQVGDEVEVTLVWENGGETTLTAEVVDPGDTMSDDH